MIPERLAMHRWPGLSQDHLDRAVEAAGHSIDDALAWVAKQPAERTFAGMDETLALASARLLAAEVERLRAERQTGCFGALRKKETDDMAFKFHRGEYLEDMITGFKGVVTVRSDYISQCNIYCLQPAVDKDGKLPTMQWFDEPRLQYDPNHIAGERVKLDRDVGQPPG